MTRHAIILRQPDGSAQLITPFSEPFVTELKDVLPPEWRKWDKGLKAWIIASAGISAAIAIARKHYGYIEDVPAPTPRRIYTTSPYATLYLLDTAPAELVPVVFRFLAKQNHPDLGGDSRTMQLINSAYEQIQKESAR